jgi:hypothetical protein
VVSSPYKRVLIFTMKILADMLQRQKPPAIPDA